MQIDRNTLLFFDASCLIAASGSPSGGSSYLLSLCTAGLLRGAVSPLALLEAFRNIQSKMGQSAARAFEALLTGTPLIIGELPGEPDLIVFSQIVDRKDAHVLSACVQIGVDFLITLDKKLIVQVNDSLIRLQALSPGEFITAILPGHMDYLSTVQR
jgi:predicted nucleic acid-binding protein